ncbi:MAG: TonB-dependent receptor, partial [Flavitalea sp.]
TAQEKTDYRDTSVVLEQVIIKAYENNRKLVDVPASVSVITKAQFERFSNTSLVPALNTTAGVRMEERSPGSYRLNIRGSSLRSPFGVRNVKIYYDGIPLTDPSGNTYLNQLGYYNIESMEIIKGPGSSIYGAGTGGAILITTEPEKFQRGVAADLTFGSYHTKTFHGGITGGTENFHHTINYQRQESDGYRDHTKLDRKVLTWDAKAKVGEKGTLRVHFMQGDLFYETPGALTAAEYSANPKDARPRVGQTPGAVEAQAAIRQKMFLAGFTYQLIWNKHWQNTTSLYGAYARVLNPTTRNYERRIEPNFGTRNIIQYSTNIKNSVFTLQGGTEIQQGYASSRVYSNKQGAPDTLQTDDELNNKQLIVFTQASLELPKGWFITGGASFNQLRAYIQRFAAPASAQERKFNNQIAPRLAILKRVTPLISVYASAAKGFSPPTNAEILPSTGIISNNLNPEQGFNYEAGTRGSFLKGRLYFDINTFYFRLQNTIAQRRDISGGDFFVNAGSARQNGLETFASYRIVENTHPLFSSVKIWVSHTWNNFRYKNYEKVTDDTLVYSGNKLPSTPPHYVTAGLDFITKPGFYANVTYTYSDPVPLNDANTDYSSSYNLAGARIGFRKSWMHKYDLDLFGVVDNIFDVKYSLGNDINALGRRYYNAAAGINFGVGVALRFAY